MEVQSFYNKQKNAVVVEIPRINTNKKIEVSIDASFRKTENDVIERCFSFLDQAEIEFTLKDKLFTLIQREKPVSVILSELLTMDLDKDLMGVLVELISANAVQ